MSDLSLYIHIPFCVRKCYYCDFLSAPATEDVQEQYFHGLSAEIAARSEQYKDRVVQTVFIGGGTPSMVEPEQIFKMIKEVKTRFNIAKGAEISMEINPGTVKSKKSFEIYKEAGINRLSIGLQSADDEELKVLGRIHTYKQFEQTWMWARETGFDNINVDVMSALPGQTVENYRKTLEKVCDLEPEHISAYSLIIEEGTPFFERYSYLAEDEEHEEKDRLMYAMTKELLGARGYRRYEISNYAREGSECRHNMVYWKRQDYLGMGIGAASLINNARYKNTDNLKKYIESGGITEYEEVETLSEDEQMEEFMFLGLRLTEGVSKNKFLETFDTQMESVYGHVLENNVKNGLLEVDGEYVRLTEKGLDLSNYVFAQFT